MDKYLTTIELSKLIKMTPGTIRNLIYKKVFKKNVHYVKPTARKLLFKRRAIESWLHSNVRQKQSNIDKIKSFINI